MSTQPDISFVIVSYNVRDLVLKCISTFKFFETKIQYEIILVDNASSDGTISSVRKDFPDVHVIENRKNAGFPKANNQAFSIAKGKYIFMLNPDTEFIDDSVIKMFEYVEKNQNTVLGPKLLNSDGSLQNSVWRFPTLWSVFTESFHLKLLNVKKNYSDKSREQLFEADSFSGAAILFNKNLIERIGMLDEKLFWIEDIDFCYRAKKSGSKLFYFPETIIVHHVGQSAKKNYKVSISNQVFNKVKFFKKYHSSVEAFLVISISFISACMKIILFLLISPFNVVWYRKFKAYVYTAPRVFNPPTSL